MKKIAKLVVTKGEGKNLSCILREGEEISIGRNLACSIPVPDIRLSRIHCIVRFFQGNFELLDNNSSNGTYKNNKPVDISCPLLPGDKIQIGDTELELILEEQP